MKFDIGYYDETFDGREWVSLRKFRFDTDAEAEAEIDLLADETPTDLDGNERNGLYIRRGNVKWFCRFSCHA